MGFDSVLSRDNELASSTTSSDRETATSSVGKRTLTEKLPAATTKPSMFAMRPSASLLEPGDDERVTYAVVLPATVREQIRVVYDQFVKTGKVIDMSGIVVQLHGLAIGTAAPDLTQAQLDAEVSKKRSLTVEGSAAPVDILAWLVGLPALPRWSKGKKPPARAAMWSVDISFSLAEIKRLRGTETQTPPIAPVTTVGAMLDWGWGVIMGDFNEEATIGQTAVGALISLIPGVDQAFDIRDIIANLYFLIGQQRYDEFGPWFGLVITIIGCVPEVGSAVKGIVNIARKVARRIPIGEALGAAKVGLKMIGPEIAKVLGVIGEVGVKVMGRARSLINTALERFARLRDVAPTDAIRNYFGELAKRAREALGRLETKVREAMKEVESRLKQLYDDLVGASDDVPVKQGDQTLPLPKTDEPTLPLSKKPRSTEQPTVPRSKQPPDKTAPLPTKKSDDATLPMSKKSDDATLPVTNKQVPPGKRGEWWEPKPMDLELDPANFRIAPKRFGSGSMSDVFEHKKNWVMKTLNSEAGYDLLSSELATKLYSKLSDLNDQAAQILGKGVVPRSHALAPITENGSKVYRPVLVQEKVGAFVPDKFKKETITVKRMTELPGVLQTQFQIEAKQMAQKLADNLKLPSIGQELRKGYDKMTNWSIDDGLHNFQVVEITDKAGKVLDRSLKWFDPFFPPSASQIIANPKLVD